MIRIAAWSLLAATTCLTAPAAGAAEVPPFLANGENYASDKKGCAETDDPGEALTIRADGVFGYEFGCLFLQFLPVRYHDGEEVNSFVAIASCGDDSGVSRPDMFQLRFDEDRVTVTSQNEYNVSSSQTPNSDSDSETQWLVERQFDLCK